MAQNININHTQQKKQTRPAMNGQIKVLCLNCGNIFEAQMNRFPICNCGNTKAIIGDAPYARYYVDNNTETITIIKGKNKKMIPIDYKTEILRDIPNIPFEHEDEVKILIKHKINDASDKLDSYTASELILHNIYMTESSVYKTCYKQGFINVAKSLMKDPLFRNYKNKNDEEHFVRTIERYLTDVPASEYLIAIDCCLERMSPEMTYALVKGKITPNMFNCLLNSVSFSLEELIKFINSYAEIMVYGNDIIKNIKEYDFYHIELSKYCDFPYPENNPIYSNLHLSKIAYNIYKENGLLAYRKYIATYNEIFSTFEINDFRIKLISSEELSHMSFNTLPDGIVSAPLIGVYENDSLISLVVNCNGKIMINGDQTDRVKKAINIFLDKIGS